MTLNSLARHNGTSVLYYIFCFENISNEKKDILLKIYPNIAFKMIPSDEYCEYALNEKFRAWSYNVFNRFEIFTLDVDKIIFLDFDIVVLGSIEGLINAECEFGACIRDKDDMPDYLHKDNFEAGIMVIGNRYINPDTKFKLLEISKSYKWTSDEPVLNYFFNDNITFLPKRYNVMTTEYADNMDDVAILHYVGFKKPWNKGSVLDRYDAYVSQKNTTESFLKLSSVYEKELILLNRILPASDLE